MSHIILKKHQKIADIRKRRAVVYKNMLIQRKIRINPLPNILLKTEGQEIEAGQSKAINDPTTVFSTNGAGAVTTGCPHAERKGGGEGGINHDTDLTIFTKFNSKDHTKMQN